ncbi:uncharacterized protein LOC119180618 isoform X1 [Rhipicephalus microplus]|uniref:uncharacterized protein LOC119180618 isoform X1 n=1 Tax=Rhipicephalus microplus TaxID=6941 RepID=UPI003F6B043E
MPRKFKTQDGNPSEAIRGLWEGAYVSQFVRLFQRKFGFQSLTTQELEDSLLNPKSLVVPDICARLLRFITRQSSILISNFEESLAELLQEKEVQFTKAPWRDLSPGDKLLTVKWLLDYAYESQGEELSEFLDDHFDAEDLRGIRVGQDALDNVYWYLEDLRLYRELCPKKPQRSREWDCVCLTVSDWQGFLKQFRKSSNPREKQLHTFLSSHLFPVVQAQAQALKCEERDLETENRWLLEREQREILLPRPGSDMKCNGAPSVDKAATEPQPAAAADECGPKAAPAKEAAPTCPAEAAGAGNIGRPPGTPVSAADVAASGGVLVNGGASLPPVTGPSLADSGTPMSMLGDNPGDGMVAGNKDNPGAMAVPTSSDAAAAAAGPMLSSMSTQQQHQQQHQQQQHQHQQQQQQQPMGVPQHQLPQHPHHHAGGTLTMGSGAPQHPHGGMPSHLIPPHQQHPQPHPGVGQCNPLAGSAHMAGGNMAVGGPSPMGGPGMGGPQVLPHGGNMGTSGLHRPPSGSSMPPGGAGCPMPPQGGAGVGGGGLEAQYMQQQSQIFVFTTGLANQAAEAVLTGQCPSIIAFHCAQPGTKRILEKHPLKIQQFSKQNPAAWLNTLAQMKQRGAQGMPGGPMGPTPGGGAMKVPQTFGPGFCGPPHACGPTHPGGAAWQPQESWGAGPYGPAGIAPQRGPSPASNRGPQQGHHPQGCGPPNGGCFPASGGAYPGMGGPGCGGNPAQMNAGVKVPDENLTPQQRQHREEQLAMIRKMQKLLFPDQQVMGNATGPPGQQQQQQTGAPQQPQGGGVPPRPRGPDQFGHCGDHQHEGAGMPPQMQQQSQPQQQQHFGPAPTQEPCSQQKRKRKKRENVSSQPDGQNLGLLQRNIHQKPATVKREDWITSSASGNQACCCAGPQGAMMGHPPADWQAQQQQGGMTAQKPYLEDRRRKGAAATNQPQGLFPACGSEFSASGSPSGYITRPGSCPNPNFNNGTTGPVASSTGNRPSSCAGFNSPGSFSNPPTPSGFPGAPGASPAGPSSSFPSAPGASPGMVFSPGAVAQQQQTAASSFGGRPPAQCGAGGSQFPGSAPCGSPALQPFSPSVRGSSGSSPPNYGASGAGGSGSPGTVPPPPRSPASGASPRLQQGPPPPYGARGPMAPSPHPPTSPSPRLGTASPATDPGARQFSHPVGGGRLANPSPGSVQTTPLSSPKPCRGGPHTPTTPGGGSAVPSPSSAGSSRKRSATPLTQDQPEFVTGINTSASTGGATLGHPGGIKGEPGLMPVPSPQQIQYLGSLESQELTIQKQANLGVPDGSLSAQGGPPHGGNPMGQNPMGPTAATQGVMSQQQGMLQSLGHTSEIPPLDMGPSLASENSQGSYHSSCSSGMEGAAPRMGPAMSDGTGGPRFATSPPYDTRFPGGAPHEAPGFGYMDPRCRVGVGPEPDTTDPSHQGRYPAAHHQGFATGAMPPHQGAAFPGASQAGPTTGARDFGEPMMGAAGFPRPGSGYVGDVPHSPHIQSLQKMTPPFDGSGKGDVPADPLNGPHRGSPGCLVPLEPASAQFMGGGGPMMSHGRGAATAAAAPYPTMAPARNSPGPRARGRGSANSAAAAAAAAASASFGGGANVQVKLGAPNTIQYLPARPQNPVAAPPHRAPSLDFLQRFTTPLTNLDTKVPTQNLQYFPPSGPPQRTGPVMMMRGGPSGPGAYAGARGLPPMDAYGGGPNGPQHGGMPVNAMFQGGKGLRPASPGGGAGGDVVSQPLPPTVGQAFSYKQGPFYGPTTADPNYAVQFHNFQQQLYATNTRSQGATTSGPSGATAAAAGFFGPK